MSAFKVGDIVRCITDDSANGLTGEVAFSTAWSARVLLDNGDYWEFNNFELELLATLGL